MDGKTKILVVDDESVIVSAAQKILSAEGFVVRTIGEAEGALQLLRSDTPAIALIDLKLPGRSGMELLQGIRREYPLIAVIMMTGYSTLDHAIIFLRNGAFDFLPKPFTFEELLSTVMRASRYVSLPAEARRGVGDQAAAHRYRLGLSSWAEPEAEGTGLLGVTDLFRQIVGRIQRIELPAVNDELRQGGMLAQIVAQDQLKHTAWSALSGRVIAVNPAVQEDRGSPDRDPIGNEWLVRVIPGNLDSELMNLSADRKT